MFKLLKKSKQSQARLGKLETAHGTISTPFFMPIATKAAVKTLTAQDMRELKAQILLSNTYHLYLQPGLKILKKAGGLHNFMDWSGPILTDSGGFQVFSLSKIRKILPHGIEFQSHIDGSRHLLTPRKVLAIQKIIGSDIAMVLDVCPPSIAGKNEVSEAVSTTIRWAKESIRVREAYFKGSRSIENVFAIVQGGLHKDLRLACLNDLKQLPFDGYALGGLAVGESSEEMYQVLDYITPAMPENKPRYLMGVGTPDNIVEAVKRGVDMFDCVIPTREARHGKLYVHSPKKVNKKDRSPSFVSGYVTINISNSKFQNDFTPINNTNLKHYTKAYLYHLFKTKEPLGLKLATLNNIDFYLRLMVGIRGAIKRNEL